MATSYANAGGSGNRTPTLVQVTVTGSVPVTVNTVIGAAVDGATSTNAFAFGGGVSNYIIEFWFASKKIIDEAKLYQSTTNTHGTWKWQGSNDRTTWTDIGSTFTLGGATTNTMTSLAGNTTAYIFYRLFQVSGTTNGSPWIYEFEFKIDEGGTTSYTHALGSGNRAGTITTAIGGGLTWGLGSATNLINGTFATEAWWTAAAAAGGWISFDLGASYLVQEARFYCAPMATNQGNWKFQGSTDNAAWIDLSGTVLLGIDVVGIPSTTCFGGFASNTTAYRYYRFLGVSGNRTTSPYELEVEFMVGPPAPPPVVVSGPATAWTNVRGRTDAAGALMVTSATAGAPAGPAVALKNTRVRTDATGALVVAPVTAGAITGPSVALPDVRVRLDVNGALLVASVSAGSVLGPVTAYENLRGRTDANGALVVTSGTQVAPLGPGLALPNLRGRRYETGALLVTGLSTSPVPPYVPTTGLISYWKLDETSGTRMDAIGTNHLTDNNAVLSAAGKVNNAAVFVNASAQFLSHASNASLQAGDIDFTWALWVFPAVGVAGLVALAKDDNAAGRDYAVDVNSGLPRIYYVNGSAVIAQSSTSVPLNQWSLIVAWHDAAADTLNIQVNNGTAQSIATGGVAPVISSSEFRIGADAGAGNKFDGLIDEVGFWKRVLTPAERTALFTGPG